MSLQNKSIPGTPEEWLRRARADLALAGVSLPPEGMYEDLCFHAQQAAEKAIKAVYRYNEWTFRYTHDLKELLFGLRDYGLTVPENVEEAVVLTDYAHQHRYPGLEEPVTAQEHETALTLARCVVEWAAGLIEQSAP